MSVRLAALAIVLTCAMTACSSDKPDPRPTSAISTASASSTLPVPTTTHLATTPTAVRPSPSEPLTTGPNVRPGEKPPTLGRVAAQHTAAGALEFGSFYMKALDWAIATNDAYLIEKIGARKCGACGRVVKAVASLKRAGRQETGGHISITNSKVIHGSFRITSDYVVRVIFNEDPVRVALKGASPKVAIPRARGATTLVFVSWIGKAWKVVEVGSP